MNAGQSFTPALRIVQAVENVAQLALINTSILSENALIAVGNVLYMLRKQATDAEDLPTIVQPDAGGPGRWFVYRSGLSFSASVEIVRPALGAQQTADVAFSVPGLAITDIITVQLTDSTYAAGITEGPVRITGSGAAQLRFANVSSGTVAGATTTYRVGVFSP